VLRFLRRYEAFAARRLLRPVCFRAEDLSAFALYETCHVIGPYAPNAVEAP
jgi:hypothetical protein